MKLLGSARGQRGGEWHGLVEEETGPCITINTTSCEEQDEDDHDGHDGQDGLIEVLHEHNGSLPQEASGSCITIITIVCISTIFMKSGFLRMSSTCNWLSCDTLIHFSQKDLNILGVKYI